jgi:hypothetical protein
MKTRQSLCQQKSGSSSLSSSESEDEKIEQPSSPILPPSVHENEKEEDSETASFSLDLTCQEVIEEDDFLEEEKKQQEEDLALKMEVVPLFIDPWVRRINFIQIFESSFYENAFE